MTAAASSAISESSFTATDNRGNSWKGKSGLSFQKTRSSIVEKTSFSRDKSIFFLFSGRNQRLTSSHLTYLSRIPRVIGIQENKSCLSCDEKCWSEA